MTPDELDSALRAVARLRPFRRIEIEFGSGDRLLIIHPEAVARRGNPFLYCGPDGSQRIFAAAGVYQILIPPPSAPSSPPATPATE
jgi:hypothetical protein